MKKINIIVFFTAVAFNANCQQDIASWFDFWVGDWELSWTDKRGNQLTGTNHVVKILDGKVIQENFYSPSQKYIGMSMSVFNPRRKKWMQTWTDNLGGYIPLEGRKEGDKRLFEMNMTEPDGRLKYYRMVFYEIKTNSFTWDWESSYDQNKWELNWRIFYRRKQ